MALNFILPCGLVTGVEEGKLVATDIRVLCGNPFHITPEWLCYRDRVGAYNHKLDVLNISKGDGNG